MGKTPPREAGEVPDMAVRGAPVVLRDVVMQGHVALARPGARRDVDAPRARPSGSGLVPVHPDRPPQSVSAGAATLAVPDAAAPVEAQVSAAVARIEEEARRKGHEEGVARGLAEGRERAAEDARQAALQAEQKMASELDARARHLGEELRQQCEAVVEARVRTLDALISRLSPQIEERLSAAEDDMLALCFETVCRMLGEAAVEPEQVLSQLAQAMARLRSRRLSAIHLHPDDFAELQRARGGAMPELPGGDGVQWIASADVALGGCILQSPEGGLDARLETQLHALRDILLQSRASVRHRKA